MPENKPGSLGYQMMKALQALFEPGASRHVAKGHGRDREVISSISTMRSMSADVHQFARFIRGNWPAVKTLDQVQPEHAQAYIEELVRRERTGGRIGRVCASLRKLDLACRKLGIFTPAAPPLLPYRSEGGQGGFHSEPRALAYTQDQAQAIIRHIRPVDPIVARLLMLMTAAGLRVTEACYLRAQDIDLAAGQILLNADGNENRTKGGRPRQVSFLPEMQPFLSEMRTLGDASATGHIFHDRRSLADRAREQVRLACAALTIPCLGTHGFRKTYATEIYHRNRSQGAGDAQALLETSRQLGHNRAVVTRQSYVSPTERKKEDGMDQR